MTSHLPQNPDAYYEEFQSEAPKKAIALLRPAAAVSGVRGKRCGSSLAPDIIPRLDRAAFYAVFGRKTAPGPAS